MTDNAVYSGSSTGTLTITGATSTMNGYQYEAVFTNVGGGDLHGGRADRCRLPPERDHGPRQTVAAGGTAPSRPWPAANPTPSVQWEVNTGSGTFTRSDRQYRL